jgi:hypothetical protein
MTSRQFRLMLRLRPMRPFLVKTTDGDTFNVTHPDFAIINRRKTEVTIYDRDDHFRVVAMNHIVSLEPVRDGAKKPGKR